MPAWNEEEGIASFLEEIDQALGSYRRIFIVVNDSSTDNTAIKAAETPIAKGQVHVHTNAHNMGHGPSTVRALKYGLDSGSDLIVAIDGDGQFLGSDISKLIDISLNSNADIVEGVRNNRNDPFYRKTTSFATRFLVWTRIREWPSDANTPLRVYQHTALQRIVGQVPENAVTPNLIISALSRKWDLNVQEVTVESIPRRGQSEIGTTWGNRRKALPSKRFISFCYKATTEWMRAPI